MSFFFIVRLSDLYTARETEMQIGKDFDHYSLIQTDRVLWL